MGKNDQSASSGGSAGSRPSVARAASASASPSARGVQEAHFRLRGMDIDVHRLGRHGEMEDGERMPPARHQGAIGRLECRGERRAFHRTAR